MAEVNDIKTADAQFEAQVAFYSDPVSPSPHQQEGGLAKGAAVLWLVLSLFGFAASAILYYEELQHRANPDELLGCSINSVLNCADAMDTWQGHLLFGVANSVWGMLAFAVMVAIGGYLALGKTLPRAAYWLFTAGLTAGVGMVCWFSYQSIWVLGALCPYCMCVWAIVIVFACLAWAITLRGGASVQKPLRGFARFWVGYWWVCAIAILAIFVIVIIASFGPARIFGA